MATRGREYESPAVTVALKSLKLARRKPTEADRRPRRGRTKTIPGQLTFELSREQ